MENAGEKPNKMTYHFMVFFTFFGLICWNIYLGYLLKTVYGYLEAQDLKLQILNQKTSEYGKLLRDYKRSSDVNGQKNKTIYNSAASVLRADGDEANKYQPLKNIYAQAKGKSGHVTHLNRLVKRQAASRVSHVGLTKLSNDGIRNLDLNAFRNGSTMLWEGLNNLKTNGRENSIIGTGTGTDGSGGNSVESSLAFTRWGRTTCGLKGNLYYAGYAAGLEYSSVIYGGQSLQCINFNAKTQPSSNRGKIGPVMSEAKLNIQDFYPSASWTAADQKRIPCSVCSWPAKSTVTLIGTDSCRHDWAVVYKGYVISQWKVERLNIASSLICIDSSPDSNLYNSSDKPFSGNVTNKMSAEYSFVASGSSAFGFAGHFIPCVLCAL